MKDKKDFIKLFDLNVPNLEHFDYYINQLSKTEKFKDIKNLLLLFEEADKNIEDFYEFKMSKSYEIIEFLKKTNTYNELCYDNNLIDLPTNKSFQYQEDINYLSVDLRSANWISLKKYDQLNELGLTYNEFLSRFGLPSVFVYSKYLRQFIFGNINPKKQQKVQRNIIQELVRDFNIHFSDFLNLECVKSDEVILSFKSFDSINNIVNSIDIEKFKVKIFNIKRVEDFRIDTIYDVNGNILNKEMVGVNGKEFFLKLKQYITNEDIDIRDLYFKADGKLAIWNVENLKELL